MKQNSLKRQARSLSALLLTASFLFSQTAVTSTAFAFSIPASQARSDASDQQEFSLLGNLEFPSVLGWKIETLEDDLYLLTQPDNLSIFQVMERLPQGGFGRLLRYHGALADGRWIDLEFVYEDDQNRVTILDHMNGQFIRTTFTGERPDPASIFPQNSLMLAGEWLATQVSSLKLFFAPSEVSVLPLSTYQRLHSASDLQYQEDLWRNRLVRGPPLGGLSL